MFSYFYFFLPCSILSEILIIFAIIYFPNVTVTTQYIAGFHFEITIITHPCVKYQHIDLVLLLTMTKIFYNNELRLEFIDLRNIKYNNQQIEIKYYHKEGRERG